MNEFDIATTIDGRGNEVSVLWSYGKAMAYRTHQGVKVRAQLHPLDMNPHVAAHVYEANRRWGKWSITLADEDFTDQFDKLMNSTSTDVQYETALMKEYK